MSPTHDMFRDGDLAETCREYISRDANADC
jgi:hypothetical protein